MIHRQSRFSLRLAATKTGSAADPINASRRLGKSPELLVRRETEKYYFSVRARQLGLELKKKIEIF